MPTLLHRIITYRPRKEREQGVAGIEDETSRIQVQTLDDNCKTFNIVEFDINDIRQGIAHVVGPEQGLTLPGMTVVCGDSHTATHGAFGCLAHGIGTSEVEHVLATQCLVQKKMKNMLVRVDGKLGQGVTPKDVVLAIIGKIGTAGGTGHAIEFGGQVFRDMSIEGRMTVCNMAIEAGARVGMVAVDEKLLSMLKAVRMRRLQSSGIRLLLTGILYIQMMTHTLTRLLYCKVKKSSHKCLGVLPLRW